MDRRSALGTLVGFAGGAAWLRYTPVSTLELNNKADVGRTADITDAQQLSAFPPGTNVFVNVEIRGGGFVTASTFSRSGNWEMCGTDTATSFVRRPGERWRSALLANSIPDNAALFSAKFDDVSDGSGSYAQAIAEGGVAYTTLKGCLIRSDDAFLSRARLVFGPKRMPENRGNQRLWNAKLAIDQSDPNCLVIGCTGAGDLGGAYFCLDTSASKPEFTRILGLPTPIDFEGHPSPILVATDPKNSRRWALAVPGTGIFLSTTGAMGPYLQSAGSPTTCQDLHYDDHGRLWVVRIVGQVADPVYSYENGAWTATPFAYPCDIKTIAADPAIKEHIVALGPNMEVYRTTKNRSNWNWNNFENNVYPTNQPYHCPDRPWDDTKGKSHKGLYPSRVVFDRKVPNRVHVSHGTGTLYFDPPSSYGGIEFYDLTIGIEQIVANSGLSYEGGDHWLAGWDKGAWKFNEFSLPAAKHYPEFTDFTHCWSMDVSPSKAVVVMLNNSGQNGHQSAFSINKGAFQTFTNQHPAYRHGGSIAAVSDTAFIWVPQGNGRAVYTTDRGATPWREIDLGVPMPADGEESGWGFANYFNARRVVASKETPGRAWLLNYGPGTHHDALGGLWRTDNAPAGPWTRVLARIMPDHPVMFAHHVWMEEVPGHANVLLISGGTDHDEPLMISRDGGSRWTAAAAKITGVTHFSFGKALPGAAWPVLRMIATVNGVFGVHEITDLDSRKVTLISEHPAGMVTDHLRAISGNLSVYGKWAYGYGGSGWRGSLKSG